MKNLNTPILTVITIIAILFLLFTSINLSAYQTIERSALPMLIHYDLDSNATLEERSRFWLEYNRGFGSTDEQFYMDFKLGGLIEFYRWEHSLLALSLSHQTTVTPYNDIGFDPKGARWNESLYYMQGTEYFNYSVGITHRCKHEIDNYDTDREVNSLDDLTKRVTLANGPFIALNKEYRFSDFQLAIGLKYFLPIAPGDYRSGTDDKGNKDTSKLFSNLVGEFNNIFVLRHNTSKNVKLYARSWNNLMFFSDPDTRYNGNIELGARIKLGHSAVNIYMAYETLYDDFTKPFPQFTEIFNIGFRFSDEMIW